MRPNKKAVIEWARRILDSNAVILDTETTGLDRFAEVLQVAIIDMRGNTLLDTLLRPTRLPTPESFRIHGLTAERLQSAPPITDLLDTLHSHLSGKVTAIYNAAFDTRLLAQSLAAYGQPQDWTSCLKPDCVMQQYAIFYGERRGKGGYRWQPLPGGDHSALGDARATLALIEHMAATSIAPTGWAMRGL
jgi:DNA polymerase III subunit epsilon